MQAATKMFLKAGKGKFLEDLKEKPVDEVLPVLKAKLIEWERKKRALPMVAKWLHMFVKRVAYKKLRKLTAEHERQGQEVIELRLDWVTPQTPHLTPHIPISPYR